MRYNTCYFKQRRKFYNQVHIRDGVRGDCVVFVDEGTDEGFSCFYLISTSWPLMTAPTIVVSAVGSASTGGALGALGRCRLRAQETWLAFLEAVLKLVVVAATARVVASRRCHSLLFRHQQAAVTAVARTAQTPKMMRPVSVGETGSCCSSWSRACRLNNSSLVTAKNSLILRRK